MNDTSNQVELLDGVTKTAVDAIDLIVKPVVWYSIAMLAVECHYYPTSASRENPLFFLWSERVVACLFTLEFIIRWVRHKGQKFFPLTPFGIIDFMAILPFWIGFIPAVKPYLHLVRTLRVMRMLKFFRYSRGLQVVALGFYRAYFNLKPLMLATLMVLLFTMFALYQVEGPHQEEFRSLFTISWFLEVTGTTVGYGDLSPSSTGGKAIVMVYMIAGLAIFMACFSAITKAFEKVFSQAENPDFNPLQEFIIVRRKREKLQELFKDVGTTNADAAWEEPEEEISLAEEQTDSTTQ